MITPLQAALILAAGTGFIAGKIDLDERIRTAIHRQNLRIATMNAEVLADTLEKRKLGVAKV